MKWSLVTNVGKISHFGAQKAKSYSIFFQRQVYETESRNTAPETHYKDFWCWKPILALKKQCLWNGGPCMWNFKKSDTCILILTHGAIAWVVLLASYYQTDFSW